MDTFDWPRYTTRHIGEKAAELEKLVKSYYNQNGTENSKNAESKNEYSGILSCFGIIQT